MVPVNKYSMNEQITVCNLEEKILINRRLLNHLHKLWDSFNHIQSLSTGKFESKPSHTVGEDYH